MKEIEYQYKKINNKGILHNIYWFLILLLMNAYVLALKGYYQLKTFFSLGFGQFLHINYLWYISLYIILRILFFICKIYWLSIFLPFGWTISYVIWVYNIVYIYMSLIIFYSYWVLYKFKSFKLNELATLFR